MRRCCMCGEVKPEDAFAYQNKAKGKRQAHCRACHAAYRRQHYLANRSTYIEREVARTRGYRETNRLLLHEYLKTHPCVDCGESDPWLLEFDHRDRSSKKSAIALLHPRKPWSAVLAEIEKCDVRCVSCHRRRTAVQMRWRKSQSSQLSLETLMVAVVAAPIRPRPEISDGLTRACTKCGIEKSITEFNVKDKKSGRRGTRCRLCLAEYARAHYERHREKYLRKASARRNGIAA